MDRKTATEEIKARWQDLYPADGRGRGKGIICPICGSGSGKNGTGISEMKSSRNHFLKCWNGGCDFEQGGSVIDLYMLEHGMNPQTDFSRAVDELAAQLNITIDPYTPGVMGWNDVIERDYPTARKAAAGTRSGSAAAQTDTAPAEPAAPAGNPSFNGTEQPAPADAEPIAEPPANFAEYYAQCIVNLRESAEAQAYLQRRGISLDVARDYSIGFDPEWISPTVVKNQQAKGSNWIPDPKPVIILPSTLQHYVSRDIRPAEQLDEQQRKFAKMNEGAPGIFGLYRALKSGAATIFITEGAFDALSVMEAAPGVKAIGLNSTSNADKLIKQLEQQPTQATFIICLDNDEAGKKTAERLKEGLRRLNINYVTADINCGRKDPNEALTADRAAFEAAITKAIASTAARPDNTMLYLDMFMGDDITRRQQIGQKRTGFANLDAKTGGGLRPGLFLIGAGTSIGKTTFCSQLADGLAENGSDVIYISLEQSKLEMMAKSLSRGTAKIDMDKAVTGTAIMDGYTPGIVLDAMNRYKEKVGNRLSIIEAGEKVDADFIAEYVRNYVRQTGQRPVLFVDYLQILLPGNTDKKRMDNRETVEQSLSKLVSLKRELDLTIICIVSLNRSSYLYPFDFESIKETGLAEFSADAVWGLQLQCFDDPLFEEEKKLKEKRAMIKAAKAEIPRKIKLVSLKHRGQQAIYECNFTYYPQYDLFIPAADTEDTAPKKAARTLTAGGKHR